MTDWSFPWPDPTNEEIVRLEAENARLKSQRTSLTEALKADNMRLQETVERVRAVALRDRDAWVHNDTVPISRISEIRSRPTPDDYLRALDGDQ